MEIKSDYSIKKLNTFGLDVKARYFTVAETLSNFLELLDTREFREHPTLILGGGSNILFTRDFNGILVKNELKGITAIKEDEDSILIQAQAGEIWDDLVNYCVSRNYGGLENLTLIPGTAGASPIQNIGAYGVEVKDVIFSVEGIDIKTGKVQSFLNKDCRFGYRNSIFKQELKNRFIITSVVYKLAKNPRINLTYEALKNEFQDVNLNEITIGDVSETVKKVRRSKLPDPQVLGNAGSFFKNPEIDKEKFQALKQEYAGISGYQTEAGGIKIPAGWLIQQCGWKGKRTGEAGVYEKQALILVNYGNAKGVEILELSKKIQDTVLEKFGITLETEVNII
ncbi:MAG: UDP-N-acetylmuramate dehydrogenase [Ignavibacteriales bacterium]